MAKRCCINQICVCVYIYTFRYWVPAHPRPCGGQGRPPHPPFTFFLPFQNPRRYINVVKGRFLFYVVGVFTLKMINQATLLSSSSSSCFFFFVTLKLVNEIGERPLLFSIQLNWLLLHLTLLFWNVIYHVLSWRDSETWNSHRILRIEPPVNGYLLCVGWLFIFCFLVSALTTDFFRSSILSIYVFFSVYTRYCACGSMGWEGFFFSWRRPTAWLFKGKCIRDLIDLGQDGTRNHTFQK